MGCKIWRCFQWIPTIVRSVLICVNSEKFRLFEQPDPKICCFENCKQFVKIKFFTFFVFDTFLKYCFAQCTSRIMEWVFYAFLRKIEKLVWTEVIWYVCVKKSSFQAIICYTLRTTLQKEGHKLSNFHKTCSETRYIYTHIHIHTHTRTHTHKHTHYTHMVMAGHWRKNGRYCLNILRILLITYNNKINTFLRKNASF